ncbi:hypothetical protein C1645_823308 [Glomus cerebriforme]|uniref:Uncharacterized protein n=1 Tax=Glomus cerebriforme TaxID=658196 RepID=A0A397T0R0_9GLOM|nr:hypothetical protein C1645_823308 [Glomus cerebriforme]
MIVDCVDNRVNLTIRKLINNEQLVGDKPMDLLRDKNYGQMQYLIQNFGKCGKIPFTGDYPNFLYELDIQDTIPILTQYITDDEIRKTLEDDEWLEVLVNQNIYKKKVKEKFLYKVKIISVPVQPIAAIACGAVIYGLSMKICYISC